MVDAVHKGSVRQVGQIRINGAYELNTGAKPVGGGAEFEPQRAHPVEHGARHCVFRRVRPRHIRQHHRAQLFLRSREHFAAAFGPRTSLHHVDVIPRHVAHARLGNHESGANFRFSRVAVSVGDDQQSLSRKRIRAVHHSTLTPRQHVARIIAGPAQRNPVRIGHGRIDFAGLFSPNGGQFRQPLGLLFDAGQRALAHRITTAFSCQCFDTQ